MNFGFDSGQLGILSSRPIRQGKFALSFHLIRTELLDNDNNGTDGPWQPNKDGPSEKSKKRSRAKGIQRENPPNAIAITSLYT